jgi:hypothetical protein
MSSATPLTALGGEAEPDLRRSRLDRYIPSPPWPSRGTRSVPEDVVLVDGPSGRRDGAAQQSVTYVDAMLIEGFSY